MIAEKTCLWCGDGPATTSREIEPAKIDRKTGKVTHLAKVVDVCEKHAQMVDRNAREQELELEIRTLNRLIKRLTPDTPRHSLLVDKRGRARLELAELRS